MSDPQTHKSWQDSHCVLHSGPVVQTVEQFSVIECQECKFKHAIPIPTPEELLTTYSHEYYTVEKPFYIERYLEDKEWWNAVYAERYVELEQYLGPDQRRILDIGSGPGLFLLQGKERGWQVKGIEPSAQAAAFSRDTLGLDIEEMFLDPQTAARLGQFDAINMGEVLEHLPDPAGILELAQGLLQENGVITLVVPNDFNPFQMLLRDQLGFQPWWVGPPHHLNYFNFDSLKALVERCGFDVLHQESTFPIDMFLLMGNNYVGNDTLGRQCHAQRKAFELNLLRGNLGGLKKELYSAFAKQGIGREIVLYARKITSTEKSK